MSVLVNFNPRNKQHETVSAMYSISLLETNEVICGLLMSALDSDSFDQVFKTLTAISLPVCTRISHLIHCHKSPLPKVESEWFSSWTSSYWQYFEQLYCTPQLSANDDLLREQQYSLPQDKLVHTSKTRMRQTLGADRQNSLMSAARLDSQLCLLFAGEPGDFFVLILLLHRVLWVLKDEFNVCRV